MRFLSILFILIVYCYHTEAQFDPDAGRIPSLTEKAVFSSSGGINLAFVNDNNINTYWESEALLPEKYINRTDLNCIDNLCGNSIKIMVPEAFDKNLDSKSDIKKIQNDGKYRLNFPFQSPTHLMLLSLKLSLTTNVNIIIESTTGNNITLTVLPEENYRLIGFRISEKEVIKSISLTSDSPFGIFEIEG